MLNDSSGTYFLMRFKTCFEPDFLSPKWPFSTWIARIFSWVQERGQNFSFCAFGAISYNFLIKRFSAPSAQLQHEHHAPFLSIHYVNIHDIYTHVLYYIYIIGSWLYYSRAGMRFFIHFFACWQRGSNFFCMC